MSAEQTGFTSPTDCSLTRFSLAGLLVHRAKGFSPGIKRLPVQARKDSQNPAFQKFTERNWKIVAKLENVAKELDRSMAQVAVNWIVNRPGVGSVMVGATKVSQLEDNLKALDFEIPTELSDRLEAISRPEPQFPYSFFEPEIQGMLHGGKPVGLKPKGYYPDVMIQSTGAGVS